MRPSCCAIHGEIARDGNVDVFQVMLTRALDDDGIAGHDLDLSAKYLQPRHNSRNRTSIRSSS